MVQLENWNVRVKTDTDEKAAAVLEALDGLGVEVITGEDSPFVNALFYVARINSKLDNIGQLRHLNEIKKSLRDLSEKRLNLYPIEKALRDLNDSLLPQKEYYGILLGEKKYEQTERRAFYDALAAEYGFRLSIPYAFMNEDQQKLAFRRELVRRESVEKE
jgi:hypothetical protein